MQYYNEEEDEYFCSESDEPLEKCDCEECRNERRQAYLEQEADYRRLDEYIERFEN